MTTHVLLLYLATWSVVALSPGPAVMCAMTHATRYGLRAAMTGIVGSQFGHVVFFGCIAGGLAAILATATTVFAVLRVIGAVYLMYLGVRIMIAASRRPAEVPIMAAAPSSGSLLLQGFAIQVTNPKALLFMSALLPQFIQPSAPMGPQLLILLTITVVVDLLVLGGYACFALSGARALKSSALRRCLESAFGAVLVFFGIRLLAASK